MDPTAVHFNTTEPVAKGTFGSVYDIRLSTGNGMLQTAVAKRVHRLKNEDVTLFHKRVEYEVRVMKMSDSDRIVKCFGTFYSDPNRKTAVIVMEKMPFDIRTYLDRVSPKGELPWSTRFKVQLCVSVHGGSC